VATAKRPDILIVDEALSVGDSYFQHKSFDRIKQFGEQGTTLLFVSHSPSAIKAICNRAILLNRGQMVMEGEPDAVLDFYNAMLADHQNQNVQQRAVRGGRVQTVSGTGEAIIAKVMLTDANRQPIELVRVGQRVALCVEVVCKSGLPELVVGFMIKDNLGQEVFGTNTYHLKHVKTGVGSGDRLNYRFSFDAGLGPGTYSISIALHTQDTHLMRNFEWRDVALIFNVVNADKPVFVGMSWLPVEVDTQRI